MNPSLETTAESGLTPATAAVNGRANMRTWSADAERVRIADLWHGRRIIKMIALRDFRARYKQAAFGPLIVFLRPFALVAGFTVIFGEVADVDSNGIPYPLFAIIGVVVWSFLQFALGQGTRCFVGHKAFVKYIPCPRIIIPAASVVMAMPVLLMTTVVALIGVVALEQGLRLQMLLIPAVLVWVGVISFCIMLVTAPAHVRWRDIAALTPTVLQASLFLAPVGYPLSEAPAALQPVMVANPITGPIEALRWCMVGTPVELAALATAAAWTIMLAAIGLTVFKRAEGRLADVI